MSLKWYGKKILKEYEQANERALTAAAIYVQGDAKLRCPVQTGRLRNSITYKVKRDEAIIGTVVEYSPYIEFGTVKMKPKPYLRPALDENKNEIRSIFKREFSKV